MDQVEERLSRLDNVEKVGHSIQENINKNAWMEYVVWDIMKTYLWTLRRDGEKFQVKDIVDSFNKISEENLSNIRQGVAHSDTRCTQNNKQDLKRNSIQHVGWTISTQGKIAREKS